MRLADVAVAFDKMECLDAYTGKRAFFGQISLYDDSKRDSESTQRRVISTAPGIKLPARRVVTAAGVKFILGHSNPDTYLGNVIRMGHVAHEASTLYSVQTLAQAAADSAALRAWGAQVRIKNLADDSQSSDLAPQSHIHFASTEVVKEGMVLTVGADLYVVRVGQVGPAGTLVTYCDRMPEGSVTTATLSSGTYNRVTEAWTGATQVIRVLRARWQSIYSYRTRVAPKFGPEDLQVVISKLAATPVPGQTLTMSDGVWQIESIANEWGVWLCRAVPRG